MVSADLQPSGLGLGATPRPSSADADLAARHHEPKARPATQAPLTLSPQAPAGDPLFVPEDGNPPYTPQTSRLVPEPPLLGPHLLLRPQGQLLCVCLGGGSRIKGGLEEEL